MQTTAVNQSTRVHQLSCDATGCSSRTYTVISLCRGNDRCLLLLLKRWRRRFSEGCRLWFRIHCCLVIMTSSVEQLAIRRSSALTDLMGMTVIMFFFLFTQTQPHGRKCSLVDDNHWCIHRLVIMWRLFLTSNFDWWSQQLLIATMNLNEII